MINIDKALDYQTVDSELRVIETEIENNESFKKAGKLKQEYADAKNKIQVLDKRAEEILALYERHKVSLTELAKKVEVIEKDVTDITEDDDLDYINSSLAKLRESVRNIESELSSVLSQIDDIIKKNDDARKTAHISRAGFEESKAKFDEFRATKQSDIDAVSKRLEQKAKEVEPALLEKYKNKRAQRMFPVLVPLFGTNRCGHCRMELAMNTVSNLKVNGYIECDTCHRLIYIK